jgi:hypothetical protein
VAVRAAPVVPALSDRPAPAAGAGEADRHPHPVGEGPALRLEQRGHARRNPIQPAFPVFVDHLAVSFSSALPSWRTAGSEGGSGDRARSLRDAPFATIPYRLGFCYGRPCLPSCVSAACGS